MGYESDQFYRPNSHDDGETLVNVTDSGHGVKVVPTENSSFSYPDNTIRGGYTPNQRSIFNEVTGKTELVTILGGGVNFDLGILKKGYIRNLQVDPGQRITKCHFQFNPTTLNQSVSQNSQILNFLQQNMAQYAQPMPSNVNFQFQLMFDRSKELNNYIGAVEQGLDTGALWAKTDPSVVGVLHDIGTLYEAIGVGLSDSQQEYMLSTLEDQIKAELLQESQEGATDLQTDTDVSEAIAERRDQASNLLEINRGNTGFLLPIPVRVVFSSLYIVEGLVQNVSVRYVKFTRNLVPMQATVEITLEGKYIGFAKKDTFFSAVLDERRRLKAEEIAAQNKVAIQNAELREVGEEDFASIIAEIFSDEGHTRFDGITDSSSDGLGIERGARLRMYPNRGRFRRVKGYWDSGNNLTVSFECKFEFYRIHKNFYDDNKNPRGKEAYDELPTREWDAARSSTVEEQEEGYEKALIFRSYLLDFIDTAHNALNDKVKASGIPFDQAQIQELDDELVGTGKVWRFGDYVFPTVAWVRTSTSVAEEGKTSFTERDQIGSLGNDDNWIARSDNLKDGGTQSGLTTGRNLTDEDELPYFPDYNGDINANDVTVFALYDLTINLIDDTGSKAVGKARDYCKYAENNGVNNSWNDGHMERDMLVDWSGGN